MKISMATSGKSPTRRNDDIAGYMGDTYWLLDGATQLKPPAHGLDASWHVGRLDQAFREALAADPSVSLDTLGRRAIRETASDFYNRSGLDASAHQELKPFSTLVLCRVTGDQLEYLIVCDSTLAVVGASGETAISDTRIDAVDDLRTTNALLRAGQGFDSAAYKAEMMEVYNRVFVTINVPGGWYTVTQDENVIDHALTGHITLKPDDHVMLMSDGFTRAVDTLSLYPSWAALLADMTQSGPDAVIAQIRAAEQADHQGQNHPRSSRHDDATVLWLRPN